ncbi:sigma-54-dependent transcriptional regulator [Govanella unica]|uniref:DNA-binding transcriptional regulator NtrC n=1 Tax=Govanella unica TaxID=2975056 RepID=A0A9X3U018_9PROT|nr:sigma-54 dependent transcriptional regulator [Govania unica]MDA5194875.1 sigma-54 dependent transcriptional regulator [Govania unica]
MTKVILIVDDEELQRKIYAAAMRAEGYEVRVASSGGDALGQLRAADGGDIDLVLLDLVMPGMTGLEVLRDIRPQNPSLPVIVLTAENSVETVVHVMRAGATDFLTKPASPDKLRRAVESALKVNVLTGEITRNKRGYKGPMTFESLIGRSPAMRQAIELACKGAASNIPILIEGESGVGKEIFARAIQGVSDRADKSFVTVNCGAIPENLVESILFGHEKGAFTGATERHDGKFVEATGGTLFLDEIGELPMDIQVKLLRAIQEGEVDSVGGRKAIKVDIRLISATNKTLIERVKDGMFREDLLYRLNVFPIRLPSLRERRDDIPLLVQHFCRNLSEGEGRPERPLTDRAMDLLYHYDWPGNVRQLENAVFRAVILADGDALDVEDFPQILNAAHGGGPGRVPPLTGYPRALPTGQSVPAGLGKDIAIYDADGHLRTLAEVERDLIQLALEKYNGHMSEIARRLGIGRSTLYRKTEELGLATIAPADSKRKA